MFKLIMILPFPFETGRRLRGCEDVQRFCRSTQATPSCAVRRHAPHRILAASEDVSKERHKDQSGVEVRLQAGTVAIHMTAAATRPREPCEVRAFATHCPLPSSPATINIAAWGAQNAHCCLGAGARKSVPGHIS